MIEEVFYTKNQNILNLKNMTDWRVFTIFVVWFL